MILEAGAAIGESELHASGRKQPLRALWPRPGAALSLLGRRLGARRRGFKFCERGKLDDKEDDRELALNAMSNGHLSHEVFTLRDGAEAPDPIHHRTNSGTTPTRSP